MKHSPNKSLRTVAKDRAAIKARFLGALRIAGLTMSEWAAQTGVTQGYVSNVLAGRHQSKSLDVKIATFTEKHLRNVA